MYSTESHTNGATNTAEAFDADSYNQDNTDDNQLAGPAISTRVDEPTAAVKERSDSDVSPRHRMDSDGSLEWDYRDDDLHITAKPLESSLEIEINGIIQESRQLSPSADTDDPIE